MNSIRTFAESLSVDQKRHGGHPEKPKTFLKAGRLSMVYQNGAVRYIRCGRNEVLRQIYSAVRDKDWLTVDPVISGERFDINPDSFTAEWDCAYKAGEIDLIAHYKLEGASDNSLSFSMEGEAIQTFEKARVGFCVLHPAEECAGKTCNITHTDRTVETRKFPRLISPDQIFMDISAMQWKAGDIEVTITFSGDVFETEDQRNWTDASYKTYCTPQELPCPATVEKGTRITQRIELRADTGSQSLPSPDETVTIRIGKDSKYDFPKMGIGKSSGNKKLTREEAEIIRKAGFDHYRADIYLFDNKWKALATEAVEEAENLGLMAELAVFTDMDYMKQLSDFVVWMKDSWKKIYAVHVFHKTELATPAAIRESASAILKAAHPGLMTGFGTNANYAELNRDRPGAEDYDFVCFSVHPQEHASDNETLTENLWGQAYAVESAKDFSQGKMIWVTPVNIQRRFNANIEAYEQPPAKSGFPPQADSRLMSLYGACWAAGSFKCISEAGASGITFFETAGERGIIQGDSGPSWPEEFVSCRGMIYPVYHVFTFLLSLREYKIIPGKSSEPLKADSLILSDGRSLFMVLINFTPGIQHVSLEEIRGRVKIKTLNENSFGKAAADPDWIRSEWTVIEEFPGDINTDPYSLVFLEYQLKF